jgi:2-phospho-L-lactate/phosphoenolpyruvate guanylyltransferase
LKYAVVPVKSLNLGKQRLSPLLSCKQRAGLSLAMASDVLLVLRDSGQFDQIFVCTGDPALGALAQLYNAELVLDKDIGATDLNTAIDGIGKRLGSGEHVLLTAHSDLPLLQTDDIHQILAQLENCDVVIAPDRHNSGSNVLARQLQQPLTAMFGENSLQQHQQQALRSGLRFTRCQTDGAQWDIDKPDDLHTALARFGHNAFGPNTREFLRHTDITHYTDTSLSAESQAGTANHVFA